MSSLCSGDPRVSLSAAGNTCLMTITGGVSQQDAGAAGDDAAPALRVEGDAAAVRLRPAVSLALTDGLSGHQTDDGLCCKLAGPLHHPVTPTDKAHFHLCHPPDLVPHPCWVLYSLCHPRDLVEQPSCPWTVRPSLDSREEARDGRGASRHILECLALGEKVALQSKEKSVTSKCRS